MKKIIAAAITVTTVLSLAACGGNTAVDKSDCLDVPQDVLNDRGFRQRQAAV